MTRRFVLPRRGLLLGGALLPLSACDDAEEAAPAAEPVRTVKLERLEPTAGIRTRSFVGRVGAVRTVELAFQVGGRITEMPVREGQRLPRGSLLAALDPEDLRLAVQEAEVQRSLAERTWQRNRGLSPGTVARAVIDEAEAQFNLRDVALRQARRNLEHATLHAPFDALVTQRLVDPFTVVAAGTAVLRVQDVTELRVAISVPEDLVAVVGQEDLLEVEAVLPSRPDLRFPLTYREHRTQPDAVAQTYQVSFGMPHPDGVAVLPGMTVAVRARYTGRAAPAAELTVPIAAIVPGTPPHVWLVEPEGGEVRRQEVALGAVLGERVAVAEGLQTGQVIVAAGAARLREGMRVRPMDAP